jgi:threonine synthase
VGAKGNFDDCQTVVKQIFGDADFNKLLAEKGFELSSANSINWGRLVPQIVYYFWAYVKMLDNHSVLPDEPITVVVPTGNFGNILAGYYAHLMGLPVNRFVCASTSTTS